MVYVIIIKVVTYEAEFTGITFYQGRILKQPQQVVIVDQHRIFLH